MAWQRKDRVEGVVSPLLRGSPGSELVRELAPRASEAVFDKLSMSAFERTPLEFALRDCLITAFVIVGVAMEVGIEPTVRHGADRGLIPSSWPTSAEREILPPPGAHSMRSRSPATRS